MKRMILLATILTVTAILSTGCAVLQSGAKATTTPEAPTVMPGETPAASQTVVTLADNGQTINLKVGESFLLKLGNEYTWAVSLSTQDVISLRRGVLVIMGAQGIYDALQPGTVVLSAAGDPLCRQSKPACAAPSILFSVTIEVSQ